MNEKDKAWRAAMYAAVAHSKQIRGGKGVPYVHHVLDVARRLTAFGVEDPDVLAAACLHDTVEDTSTKIEDISLHFGSRVAILVAQLTLPKEVENDYKAKTAHQSRMMSEMTDEGRLIKIADKWSNVSDLIDDPPSWGKNAFIGYATDARTVVSYGIFASNQNPDPVYHEKVLAMAEFCLASVNDVLRRHG